jgi:hypothetical protein
MSFCHRRQLHDSFESRVYAELERERVRRSRLDLSHTFGRRNRSAVAACAHADGVAGAHTRRPHRGSSNTPIVAKIEVKTSGYHDGRFAIEAFPLAVHILEAKTVGAACLYICFQRAIEYEFGFWAGEIQERIDGVYIPPYWHAFTEQYPEWLRCAFPDTPIRWLRYPTGGSNTPYATLAPSAVRSMAHWKTVLRDWLQRYTAPMAENASFSTDAVRRCL